MLNGGWQTDAVEKSLHELEFKDLNIHLYLTLNYGMASEHLVFDSMVLYNAFVLSWGLTITQNSIRRISDLDRSGLSDTRSAENDWIGADTDPEYRIDASLVFSVSWPRAFGYPFPQATVTTWPRCLTKRVHVAFTRRQVSPRGSLLRLIQEK